MCFEGGGGGGGVGWLILVVTSMLLVYQDPDYKGKNTGYIRDLHGQCCQ